MLIQNIRSEFKDGKKLIKGELIWENRDAPPFEIYIGTDSRYANFLQESPDAFVIAASILAIYFKEKRLKADAPLCPVLLDGLNTNMGWFSKWYDRKYLPVKIEHAGLLNLRGNKRKEPCSGSFVSGGIDSLFTLRKNFNRYGSESYQSLRYGIFVYGFDIGWKDAEDERMKKIYQQTLKSINTIAEEVNMTMIPVFTNIRHIHRDVAFWTHWFYGAALSFVAHSFSALFTKMLISADDDRYTLKAPWGSHPVIIPNYSSDSLEMGYYGFEASRFEKMAVLSKWPTAIRNLRVCTKNISENLNCGVCEKCIRTLLALKALNQLDIVDSFLNKKVDLKLLSRIGFNSKNAYLKGYYRSLAKALKENGDNALANKLESELGVRGFVKNLDDLLLFGLMKKTWGGLVRLKGDA